MSKIKSKQIELDINPALGSSDIIISSQKAVKSYVDSKVAAASYVVQNGVNLTSGTLGLGGPLTKNATITGPAFSLNFGTAGNSLLNLNANVTNAIGVVTNSLNVSNNTNIVNSKFLLRANSFDADYNNGTYNETPAVFAGYTPPFLDLNQDYNSTIFPASTLPKAYHVNDGITVFSDFVLYNFATNNGIVEIDPTGQFPDFFPRFVLYNRASNNYTGDLLPVNNTTLGSINGRISVLTPEGYLFFILGGSTTKSFYKFDVVNKVSTLYSDSSGTAGAMNYTGDVIPTTAWFSVAQYADNVIFGHNLGITIFNISGSTVTNYNAAQAHYTGAVLTNANSVIYQNNFIYGTTAANGLWELDLNTNIARFLTNVSANYSGDTMQNAAPRSLMADQDGVTIYMSFTVGGFWKFDTSTNTGTRYNASSNNYSGDLIPTGAMTFPFYDAIDQAIVYAVSGKAYRYLLGTNNHTVYQSIVNSNTTFTALAHSSAALAGSDLIFLGSKGLMSATFGVSPVAYSFDSLGLKYTTDILTITDPKDQTSNLTNLVDKNFYFNGFAFSNGLIKDSSSNKVSLGGNISGSVTIGMLPITTQPSIFSIGNDVFSNSASNVSTFSLSQAAPTSNTESSVSLFAGDQNGTDRQSSLYLTKSVAGLSYNDYAGGTAGWAANLSFDKTQLAISGNSGAIGLGINQLAFKKDATVIVSSTYNNFAGLQYAIDFSSHYTSRSLVDKAYVDNKVVTGTVSGTAGWALNSANAYLLNNQNAAFYLNRANHTGTQLVSTISDLSNGTAGWANNAAFAYTTGTTVSNGLTKTSNNVTLGGTLTSNTTITGDHSVTINPTNASFDTLLDLQNNVSQANWYLSGVSQTDSRAADITGIVTSNQSTVLTYVVDDTGLTTQIKLQDVIGFKGIEVTLPSSAHHFVYAADYSANYTTRSIVDKGYVDSLVGAAASVPTKADKNYMPLATTSGLSAYTGIMISYTPANDSYVDVEVNGISAQLGTGPSDGECYFSAFGAHGTSGRLIKDITATDELYWNRNIANYDLDFVDRISLFYNTIS